MGADTRGLVGERHPRWMSDLLIAAQLMKRDGLAATIDHARTIALRRLHSALIDRPMMNGLPHPLVRQHQLSGLTLRTSVAAESAAGAPCSPVPAKTLDCAIRGIGVDPTGWDFVDIGSGTGWALQVALGHAFRAFTGVEFAYEMHQKAEENFRWLTAQGRTQDRPVHLRHESALETELPSGPCVILLFCSFDERILRPFVQRIERSVADNPRPVIVLYVNATNAGVFARPGIREVSLRRPYATLIRAISPYSVRAYRFGPVSLHDRLATLGRISGSGRGGGI